jgi:hypothetical protein
MDELLVRYMNELFETGNKSWKGEKLVAALCFFSPQFGRHGALHIPRAIRCLKGWQKASPSRSRRPLVWPVWAAIAIELFRMRLPLVAVLVIVMVDCYLRPSEMLSLTPSSFLAPAPSGVASWVLLLFPAEGVDRSKVGEADDTIPLDSRRLCWMGCIYKELASRRPSDARLLGMSYAEFLVVFKRAAASVGVDAVPYQARHSGASVDRAEGSRSLEACQKRGRWASAKSVKRYEKAGRLNQTWRELSAPLQAHCAHCANILEDVLVRGAVCPAPPPRATLPAESASSSRRRASRR